MRLIHCPAVETHVFDEEGNKQFLEDPVLRCAGSLSGTLLFGITPERPGMNMAFAQ